MGFDDKKIKVTRFRIDGWTDEDTRSAAEKIKTHLALPLDQILGEEPNIGWADGKAELNLDLGNCMVGENIFVSMRIAARKIPAGIKKALYRKKAEEYKKATKSDYISRKEKLRIEEEVRETLLPRTMPTVKSAWVIITPDGMAYLGSVGNREKGLFTELFAKTFKKELHERTIFDIVPSEQCNAVSPAGYADLEFLTDLFRQTEDDDSDSDFAVSAPFDLVSTDDTSLCTRALAAGDAVSLSPEVRAALKQNKLFKKLRMSVGNFAGYGKYDRFEFTLTRDFGMSGLQTPEGEEQEFAARFAEKLGMLRDIFDWIDREVADFVNRATSPDFADKKRAWIAGR